MSIDQQIRIPIERVNRYRYAIPQPIDMITTMKKLYEYCSNVVGMLYVHVLYSGRALFWIARQQLMTYDLQYTTSVCLLQIELI